MEKSVQQSSGNLSLGEKILNFSVGCMQILPTNLDKISGDISEYFREIERELVKVPSISKLHIRSEALFDDDSCNAENVIPILSTHEPAACGNCDMSMHFDVSIPKHVRDGVGKYKKSTAMICQRHLVFLLIIFTTFQLFLFIFTLMKKSIPQTLFIFSENL